MDAYGIVRNDSLAVLSYDYLAWLLVVTDNEVFRVHAFDVIFLRHVGLRCCIGLIG